MLLNREIERQALQLSKAEQYEIMKLLAKDFVEFDIVSEELSFVKELFQIHDPQIEKLTPSPLREIM